MPVIAIEIGLPIRAYFQTLADQIGAIAIPASYRTILDLFQHLRITGRVQGIDKILSSHAIHRLGNPVAVAVLDDLHLVAVLAN